MTIKAVILMADYGNDPTEVATPWHVFKEAGWDVSFATENGAIAGCDKKMYEGLTQKLLGAQQQAVQQHAQMRKEPAYQNPISWSSADFSLKTFDLVFLPGGHDKGMKQYIESKKLHQLLAEYVPLTSRKDSSNKHLAAICHGVQVLAASDKDDGTSNCVIHDFETTALPGPMEQGIFYATAPFLGSYYKTYGVGSPSVEQIVSIAY